MTADREPMTLAEIHQAFMRLAEVINRELTPEKILRAACLAYSERMAEINRRPVSVPGQTDTANLPSRPKED